LLYWRLAAGPIELASVKQHIEAQLSDVRGSDKAAGRCNCGLRACARWTARAKSSARRGR
jgi:hypothetical protein